MVNARKIILAVLVCLFGSGQLVAQTQTGSVTGRVTDSTTAAVVPNASLRVEGTALGTTVAADGSFTLTGVPVGAQRITARLIGYGPVTLQVTVIAGQTATANFEMQRQALVMDEVVVTGYGSQRRAEITGSIATVNADQANVGVIDNADDLIRGRVAGVNITQNTGEPGSGVQIRVRGGTSISARNEPLYVIDGITISNLPSESEGVGIGGSPSLSRNPLNLLNPSDIESITVLKDAAAAAIYGARGANGVILIETKQGQRGRMAFEYQGYVSTMSRARSLNLMTGEQYRQFIQDQVAAGNLPPERLDNIGSANTDWEREVTPSAFTQNHTFAFTGGTETTQYRASLNYMNQEGVALNSGFERFQGRLNGTQYAWDDRLQLRLDLTASHINNNYVPFQNDGGFEGAVMQNMVQFNPNDPIMQTNPVSGQEEFFEIGPGTQSVRNPVAMAEQLDDDAGTTRVLASVRAQLQILRTLSFQLILGADRSESTRRTYYPNANPVGAQTNGLARQSSLELTSLTSQSILTWGDQLGQSHNLEILGGYEWNDFDRDQFSAEAQDFLTDAFRYDNLAAGNQLLPQSSNREDKKLVGFFGRVNYGYKDRYFVTGVLRYDGSSVFGADNKWGVFPALSASWRISQEGFMQNSLFSELRLRAGYGLQGTEAVEPYASLITLAPGDNYVFGESAIVGVAPNKNANPILKWERTSQFNVAVDYGLADNRISGSFEYYVKNTSDLLLEVVVPQPAAVERRLENIGSVRNQGLEAVIDWLAVTNRSMTLDFGLVFAAERNKVTDLGDQSFITTGAVSGQGQSGQVSQRIIPGFPLGTFYGPEFAGVNSAGEQEFNDYDDNGNIVGVTTSLEDNDFVPIGDANPNFTLGLRSGLTWGKVDASFLIRWWQGLDVFNNTALVFETKSNVLQNKNFLSSALDDPTAITQPAIYSSRWIEDASFLRLQNISVGYTFQLPGLFVGRGSTMRAYVSADNLFLITGYTGYDPEAFTQNGIGARGTDYLSYPRARTFSAGLGFTF